MFIAERRTSTTEHYAPKKFDNSTTQTNTETGMVAAGETVIMKTAMVTINGNNANATTRAFLDSGSFGTYLTKELMTEID